MLTVKSFKLITGEEVVAEVLDTTELNGKVIFYSVRKPHVLSFQPVGPGQLGLAFIPWTLSSPEIESITIPASAVVVAFEPAEKVVRQYLEQTSRISIATSSELKQNLTLYE